MTSILMARFFTINGKKSSDLNIALPKEFTFESSDSSTEFVEVPGMVGELALESKSLKNVKRKLSCGVINRSKRSYHEVWEDISDWLAITGWSDLTYSDDPLYVYKGLVSESFTLVRVQQNFFKLEIEITLKPIKYLKSELAPKVITNGTVITNKKKIDCKPLLVIEGMGDVSISISNQKLDIKSLDKIIELDCQNQTAMQGSSNVSKKVYGKNYPVLKKGDNKISWTGNITKVTITTRLGARI